ncbi:MAG: GatB/YqeY domain-containing protein [Acidobacteriota bacterium]
MAIAEQVEKDLVTAMKAREELRLSVLRMAKTALKNKQIDLGKPLSDDQAFAVLRSLVKQRRDSVEQFRKGGREDLATKEEAEIEILQAYLPAEASEEVIAAAIAAAIEETGAAGPQDLGKVMKAVMSKLADKNADGRRVNQMVRARLGA